MANVTLELSSGSAPLVELTISFVATGGVASPGTKQSILDKIGVNGLPFSHVNFSSNPLDGRYVVKTDFSEQLSVLSSSLQGNIEGAVNQARADIALGYYNRLQIDEMRKTGARSIRVANMTALAEHDALVDDKVHVEDAGGGKWAKYEAASEGTNATYVLLITQDEFSAVMSADQIEAAYESRPNTNKFNDAYKSRPDSLSSTDALTEGATNQYFTQPRVRATTLFAYAKASVNRAISAADSILVAIGLLEKKTDDLESTKQVKINLTTTGTSGVATFNQSTGALNIPNYQTSGTGTGVTTGSKGDINVVATDNWQLNPNVVTRAKLHPDVRTELDGLANPGGVPNATPLVRGIIKQADSSTAKTATDAAVTPALLGEEIEAAEAAYTTIKGFLFLSGAQTLQASMNKQVVMNGATNLDLQIPTGLTATEIKAVKMPSTTYKIKVPNTYTLINLSGLTGSVVSTNTEFMITGKTDVYIRQEPNESGTLTNYVLLEN